MKQLLECGADVNIQDNDLWTPLHVAAACGSKEIVKLLLEVSQPVSHRRGPGDFVVVVVVVVVRCCLC